MAMVDGPKNRQEQEAEREIKKFWREPEKGLEQRGGSRGRCRHVQSQDQNGHGDGVDAVRQSLYASGGHSISFSQRARIADYGRVNRRRPSIKKRRNKAARAVPAVRRTGDSPAAASHG